MVDARIEPTDSVVDIGCGVGRFTRAFANRAADVRGNDVSPRMLELARQYNGDLHNVDWIDGDGQSLTGIPDASADVCFSHVVFQHIPDPEITLGYVREIGRALRPGGWALFQVSNDPSVHGVRNGRRATLRAAIGRSPRGQRHPNWRGSHVDLDALREAAVDGGMSIERIEGEGTQFCIVRTRRRGASRVLPPPGRRAI
jgi:SAM-dependent methyltransferase